MITVDQQPEWLTIPEFLRRNPRAGSRGLVYDEAKRGRLKPYTIRLGARVLIRADAYDRLREDQAR